MNEIVKKVLKAIYRVYSIFCMCLTVILFVASIVLLISFGRITAFLVNSVPALQLFFQ